LAAHLARFDALLERLLEREREQLPLWVPVGVGLGIAAWFWLPDGAAWMAFLIAAAATAMAALAAAPATRWGRAAAIFAIAAMIGCALIWWRAERVAAPTVQHARMAEFSATIEQVQPLPARAIVRLLVMPAGDAGLPPRVRINLDQDKWTSAMVPGAAVRFRSWLMPPAPMAVPGAYDFARYAWFQRIGGSGRAVSAVVIRPGHDGGWRSWLSDRRRAMAGLIEARLGSGAAGIAIALATGDQGAVAEDDAEAMRQSGLAHLLSVSGLHLTAVVGAIMFLTLRLLALSPALALRWPLMLIAAGAGAGAGVAYTLFTGAEVPTVRACIAALLVLAAMAFGREALTLRLVATAALIVLLLWPETLAGPSFQLSFAAITAIVALHEHPRLRGFLARRDEAMLRKLGRNLVGLLLTGVVVEVALAPIALYHFHQTGLYGALANILAIPLTTFVVMPLEIVALLLDPLGLGGPFWWLTGKALQFLLVIAHVTAGAPGAVTRLGTMPTAAFALMAAGGLWIALWRTRWRRWGTIPLIMGGIWALSVPSADLIVTGDGQHLALRAANGTYAVLRPRAGDYVRDLLSETAGADAELADIDALPDARCSRDLCFATIARDGRRWRLLATRSPYRVPWEELTRACRSADIVVSDRWLPRGCTPRWLKADAHLLRRTGGLAIRLGAVPSVETVAERVGRHPWAQTGSGGRR
jgi:competence protein ComEC